MAEEPYGIGINLENTGLVRFVNGTLERIRRDGTWNTLVPQVVDGARPGAGTSDTEVSGLMRRAGSARGRRRHPAGEPRRPRAWIRCRRCGRWPPRRSSGRTSTTTTRTPSAASAPSRRIAAPGDGGAQALAHPAARRRTGGDPPGPRDRPARRLDGQSRCRRVEAVLLELRPARRPLDRRARGELRGLVPPLRQRLLVRAPVGSGRHGRRPVRDQGLHRPRRTGLGVPGRRPQRQRTSGRAQGPGALRGRRGAGDRDGRAAVPGRGGPPVDREDLQLRRAPRLPRRAGRLHRDGVRRRQVAQAADGARSLPVVRGDRLHAGDPAGDGLPALDRVVLQRPQAGEHHGRPRSSSS